MMCRNWIIAVALMALCGGALADDDYLKARRLQKSGDIVAVEQILGKVRQSNTGRVIEVDLHEEDGRYLYEIELVDGQGEVKTLFFDARTGAQARGNFKHH